MIIEDKIINDILFHLPDWRINNNPKNSSHVNPFIENSTELESTGYRKEITSNEVLSAYESTKLLVQNYLRRNQFPNNPIIHEAICMWCAGRLAEKYHFHKDDVTDAYSLINDAQDLLKPYRKQNINMECISGEQFDAMEYMEYDDNDSLYNHGRKYHEEYEPIHRTVPKRPPRQKLRIDEDYHISKNRIQFDIDKIKGTPGDNVEIVAYVYDKYGRPLQDGNVKFYIYDKDNETD